MILADFNLDEGNLTRVDARVNPAKPTYSSHIKTWLLQIWSCLLHPGLKHAMQINTNI